uniref:Uncharacterized protein n=1 Tax=viral metagenome TaxID=1070528 RepID=A0A6C0ES09_9ZZZZ
MGVKAIYNIGKYTLNKVLPKTNTHNVGMNLYKKFIKNESNNIIPQAQHSTRSPTLSPTQSKVLNPQTKRKTMRGIITYAKDKRARDLIIEKLDWVKQFTKNLNTHKTDPNALDYLKRSAKELQQALKNRTKDENSTTYSEALSVLKTALNRTRRHLNKNHIFTDESPAI